jgi:hypothetical protein
LLALFSEFPAAMVCMENVFSVLAGIFVIVSKGIAFSVLAGIFVETGIVFSVTMFDQILFIGSELIFSLYEKNEHTARLLGSTQTIRLLLPVV